MYLSNKRFSHKRFYARLLMYFISFSASLLPLESIASTLATQASTQTSCTNQSPIPPTSTVAPATPGIILINEVLPFSSQVWNCTQAGKQYTGDSWVELYNPQNEPLNLYDARASIDQGPGTTPCLFRLGAIITAHGFFTCMLFTNGTSNAYAHPFLARLLISQTVIDQITTPALTADTAYARIPDGSNNWQITTTPTINSSNSPPNPTTSGTSTHTRSTAHPTSTTHPSHQNNTSNNTHATMTTTNIQPTWSALWFPPTRTPDTPLSSPGTPTTIIPNSILTENNLLLPMKILLTILILLAPGVIFWQWKLFKKRKAQQHT